MDGMSIGPIRPGCVLRTLVAPLSSELKSPGAKQKLEIPNVKV